MAVRWDLIFFFFKLEAVGGGPGRGTNAIKRPWVRNANRCPCQNAPGASLAHPACLRGFTPWWSLLLDLPRPGTDCESSQITPKPHKINNVTTLFIINFYWHTVVLQCYVSFCCTAKWIGYMYTYMPSFFGFPSHSGHHRALSRAPGARHWGHISYLFHA